MTIEQINNDYLAMTQEQHEQAQAKLNAMYEQLDMIMAHGHGRKGQWIPGG